VSNDPKVHDPHHADDEGRVGAPHRNSSNTKAPANMRTYAMSSMRVSREGLAFIASVEGSGHDTDGLQWPRGSSGVTVGLGYDLHAHTPGEIVSDLTSIGIDRKKAEFLASAQKKTGADAGDFANKYKNIINLTNSQKQELLKKVIGKYEKIVKDAASFPVTQYQFDALVALAYNPGGPINVITRSLTAGNVEQAKKDWLSRSFSKKVYYRGLHNRREREINLYKNGIYD
jgi:GH24 family phage-related lysozyme (muramidase)